MPITVQFKPAAKLIIITHVGSVSDDEFLSSYIAFYDDPRFDNSFHMLVDLQQAKSSERSQEALRAMAGLVRERLATKDSHMKVAVFAPGDVSFGMARMFEAFGDIAPVDVEVFRSADKALAWLCVPENLMDD